MDEVVNAINECTSVCTIPGDAIKSLIVYPKTPVVRMPNKKAGELQDSVKPYGDLYIPHSAMSVTRTFGNEKVRFDIPEGAVIYTSEYIQPSKEYNNVVVTPFFVQSSIIDIVGKLQWNTPFVYNNYAHVVDLDILKAKRNISVTNGC